MSKIELTDTFQDIVVKMSNGNPGALAALVDIYKRGSEIDPQGMPDGLGAILLLDTYGIYGTDIYVLYSDICGKDVARTLAVIRASQLGFLSSDVLKDACSRQDRSGRNLIDVDGLHKQVRERLTQFDVLGSETVTA